MTMTPAEFRERLARLQEVITRGLAYYAVWKKLRLHDQAAVTWTLEEQNQLLGRFREFFTPVGFALQDMTLMQFAKAFDSDPRTASLTVLLGAAQQDLSLIPGATSTDVANVSAQLQQDSATLKTLKQMRNQKLAHADAHPVPVTPLQNSQFDTLVERVVSAFNRLSTAHDGRVVSWDHMLGRSETQTAEVFRILREEMGRKQQEYEEEMVRIGLHEVRRMQMTMGRRLGDEELQYVKKQYGLTEEQMQRIEKEYSLS